MRILNYILMLGLLGLFGTTHAVADDDHGIPLKLFGQNVLEGHDGCAFSLWQKNRNPNEDKYAYVFYAPIHDGGVMPAWMKIGDKVHEMYRQDVGDAGQILTPYQLYKSDDSQYWVILEIFDQHNVETGIVVDRAELTIIGFDQFPFVSEVVGKNGCPDSYFQDAASSAVAPAPSGQRTYNSLYGDAMSLQLIADYYEMSYVPVEMQRHVSQNYASCDMDNTNVYSAHYAISDAMSLWQVPCAIYAHDTSANFYTVLNSNPEYFAPVYVNVPQGLPGFENGDLKELLNAYVEPNDATITASSLSNAGDCGDFWKYQLRVVEGEAVEAFLAEYRRKDSCDGNYTDPSQYPVIYMAD